MKKIFFVFVILMLVLFCACGNEEPETVLSEKVIVTFDGKDYEVFVPEKTRFEDDGEGNVRISTPSLSEGAIVDLFGISGCEYIINFDVVLNTNTEKLILPNLPNAQNYHVLGAEVNYIDASAAEGSENIQIIIETHDIDLGKGPDSLYIQYELDISALAGAENVKSITLHGDCDLSKIADIGEVEKVYILGENSHVSGLENLKSLKRLSFQSFSGDLSGIKNLSMETLVFNSDVTQETLDTLSESKTVKVLHLNDEFITNSDFLDKLPNLRELVLTVDPIQPTEVPMREEIADVSQIDALMTNIPKEKLKAFFEKGGAIFIMDDWSRT